MNKSKKHEGKKMFLQRHKKHGKTNNFWKAVQLFYINHMEVWETFTHYSVNRLPHLEKQLICRDSRLTAHVGST